MARGGAGPEERRGRGLLRTRRRPFVPAAGAGRPLLVRSWCARGQRAPGRPRQTRPRPGAPPSRQPRGSGQRRRSVRRMRGLRAAQPPPRAQASGLVRGLSVSAQPLVSKRLPGCVLLPRAGRVLAAAPGSDAHGSANEGGRPGATGGGSGCEVSSCGRHPALRRTPLRRDGQPGRSWGRGQRTGSSRLPNGRMREVVASALTSHQTVNLEDGVC